ncbi:MAG: hypothetical protein J6T20_02130 [Treponema sp.]|nr:hypothetical protein [Treponema sp.]
MTSKAKVKKTNLFSSFSRIGVGYLCIVFTLSILSLSLTSCKDFLNSAETVKQIEDAVAYANAPSYTISIDYPSGKGVIRSPAGGEVQKKCTDKFTLHFDPSTDCEFAGWTILDSVSGKEFKNGEYLTLDSTNEAETTCTFTKEPPASVKLTLKVTVAPRAQVISWSPMTSNVLKDSSIQVVFDYDMDENSIYYIDKALEKLTLEVGEKNLLYSKINKGKVYGYIKDGKTFFKNISFENNESHENITDYFDEPFFSSPRVVNVNTSKTNKLEDFTEVLVSFEKDFFYKVDKSNPKSKEITMTQSKRWTYQVNDEVDKEPPRVIKDEDVEVCINSGANLTQPTKISSSSSVPAISKNTLFNRDKKIGLKVKITDTGSGPASNFALVLTKIRDNKYADISEPAVQRYYVNYQKVTSQNGILNKEIDLASLIKDGLSDGVYKMYFEFTDRCNKTLTYPQNAAYYFTVDNTAPEGKEEKISAGANDIATSFKLSWTPVSADFAEAIVSYKTNGNFTKSYTITKGTNGNSQALTLSSISNKYEVSIVYKDFAGNESKPYVIPKFMTGFSVTGTAVNKIEVSNGISLLFDEDKISDYGFKATAYFSDLSTSDVSSSVKISSSPTYTAKTIDVTFTSGYITRKSTLSGTYLVAASGAKPTERPVRLTDYQGGRQGEIYYKFGDFPQTIAADGISFSNNTVYKSWYLGSDGYFYAKCKELGYNYGTLHYSDGSLVTKYSPDNPEKYLYFRVEPIVWWKKTSSNGEAQLLSEKILTANFSFYGALTERKVKGKTIYPNDYKYSNIRAYLNGIKNQFITDGGSPITDSDKDWTENGFLPTAFTSSAQNLILVTQVDYKVGYDKKTISDKIFILESSDNNKLSKPGTDFAIANYLKLSNNYGGWITRSQYLPTDTQQVVYIRIDSAGKPDESSCYANKLTSNGAGILPALCVNESDLKQ